MTQPDHVEGHEASANNEFLNIVKAIWISFLIMKSIIFIFFFIMLYNCVVSEQYMSNTSEDLISAFHLLLCIMEHFLKDITASAPHFVHSQICMLSLLPTISVN